MLCNNISQNYTDEEGYNAYDFRNGTRVIRNLKYSTFVYRDESLRIIKKHVDEERENPFFLYLPFQAPHAPFQAPKSVVEGVSDEITGSNRRKLAAVMTALDDSIGQIVDYLKSEESGYLWDDTLLIISSDNGGDTDYEASNFPLRGTKGTLYEGGVKAIGLVNGGWLNDDVRGTQMDALMHSSDWFVTLQSFAGIEPSVDYLLDGLDQSDNLMNGNAVDIYSPREVLLHNAHEVAGAVRWRDYKLVRASELTADNETDYGLLTKCHSFWCVNSELDDTKATIQCQASGNFDHPTGAAVSRMKEYVLFNIVNDPCEYWDIKEDEPEIYENMIQMLLDFKDAAAPALFYIYPEDYDAVSSPDLNGVWSPWIGLDDDDNEVLSVKESIMVQSQQLGVLQHLVAPSIAVLVLVGVLVIILQIAARVARQKKKDNMGYVYGAV